VRLPRSGTRCPITGLSRAGINQLILPCPENGGRPPVKSLSLRKKGATRGVRMIPREALIEYLMKECEKQNQTKN